MPSHTYLFVGGCNRPTSYFPTVNAKGIAVFRFDETTGSTQHACTIEGIDNPTYLCLDAERCRLYAVSEVVGWEEGVVSAYAIDPASGSLSYISKQATRGSCTAQTSLDRSRRFLFVANYGQGLQPVDKSFAVLPIRPDGGLSEAVADAQHTGSGPDPARQERPHPHAVLASPDNRFLIVADLGIDQLVTYRFDAASGAIARAGSFALPPGSGPRHFVFHPSGRFVHLANELASNVASLAFEAQSGGFSLLGIEPTVPAAAQPGNRCAAIRVTPDGRFLYVSNRGHDSIAVLAIAPDGKASLVETIPCGGRTPRDIDLDPSGRYLAVANQNSDTLSIFAAEGESGGLTFRSEIAAGTPTCVAFGRLAL
jgi:6-phosphogluconolactonase